MTNPEPAKDDAQLSTERVSSGISPRVIGLAVVGVLVFVVAIAALGRETRNPPVPAVAADGPTPSPSSTATQPALASAVPAVPNADPTDPPGLLPTAFWPPYNELYQVVIETRGQRVSTFLVPTANPSLEGGLSLRGTNHRLVSVSIYSFNDDGMPEPTKVRAWQFSLPLEAMRGLPNAPPLEAFRVDLGPATDDPTAPLLQRSAYTFTVNAQIYSNLTALTFVVEPALDGGSVRIIDY